MTLYCAKCIAELKLNGGDDAWEAGTSPVREADTIITAPTPVPLPQGVAIMPLTMALCYQHIDVQSEARSKLLGG